VINLEPRKKKKQNMGKGLRKTSGKQDQGPHCPKRKGPKDGPYVGSSHKTANNKKGRRPSTLKHNYDRTPNPVEGGGQCTKPLGKRKRQVSYLKKKPNHKNVKSVGGDGGPGKQKIVELRIRKKNTSIRDIPKII